MYQQYASLMGRQAKSQMHPVQCKMARAALGLGVRDLAKSAGVAINTVTRFERGEELLPRTLEAIRATLESAGIIFLADGETAEGGPGVRLKKSSPQATHLPDGEAGIIENNEM
ncbi:transcriptional regulator [Mesorhizobium sp. LjNodule214]|uniref:transcriptional regulator n=1 Tax=Mesorhizobium sp. LjNodule214 TaxID=3342252 RepID=UPI003F508961